MNTEYLSIKGSDLIGLKYQPLFPFFKNTANAFQILEGDFVTTEDGTGIVHCAPGFGEEDYAVCKKNGIKTVCPVDNAGKFTNEIYKIDYKLGNKNNAFDVSQKQVFETEDQVIKYLKGTQMWLKTEQYFHNYPHCWRTDTPLIYKTVSSWYVEVSKFKNRMVELNQQINWIPENVKNGIFGKWLENARDWSISRNRFWGCPVPIWRSNDPKYPRIDVYGSIADLEKDFGLEYKQKYGTELKITDLHRPFIDNLIRKNPDDPTGQSQMVRVEDVLDCWFESGSMPYASVHYPFNFKENGKIIRTAEQNQEWFKKHFPADFIVEYMAQTRGWFYTLMVLSTALFDRPPFLNCICHGVILDEKSQKLSKRLKNYPDPMLMFNVYGSDAMRFMMAKAPVMRGSELNMDAKGAGIAEIAHTTLAGFWNSYTFLKTYMDADKIGNMKDKKDKMYLTNFLEVKNVMDLYILTKINETCHVIEQAMDSYNTPVACNKIDEFLEVFSNWYIRRNKERFWESIIVSDGEPWNNMTVDKKQAYQTLYTCLMLLCNYSASLLPCITEKIYLELTANC